MFRNHRVAGKKEPEQQQRLLDTRCLMPRWPSSQEISEFHPCAFNSCTFTPDPCFQVLRNIILWYKVIQAVLLTYCLSFPSHHFLVTKTHVYSSESNFPPKLLYYLQNRYRIQMLFWLKSYIKEEKSKSFILWNFPLRISSPGFLRLSSHLPYMKQVRESSFLRGCGCGRKIPWAYLSALQCRMSCVTQVGNCCITSSC